MRNKTVVVGGGNIGTLLLAELIHNNPEDEVTIQTGNSSEWTKTISVYDSDNNLIYSVSDFNITEKIIPDAEYYFFALPKNVIRNVIKRYIENVNGNCTFIFLPGTGGVEYLYAYAKSKNISFVGLQRVPYIARLKEYGRSVYNLSKKDMLFVALLGTDRYKFLEEKLGVETNVLDNYLCVTLTPSNPILHPARIFSMFSENEIEFEYERNFLFYEEWDDKSSEYLIAADSELQEICNSLPEMNLRNVVSLKKHYGSNTVREMTNKLSSIKAFKGIKSPMKKTQNGKFVVDLHSRYFLEDFDFGLRIIKDIADILHISVPTVSKILAWYDLISHKSVSKEDMLLPSMFNIKTRDDLINFYLERNFSWK